MHSASRSRGSRAGAGRVELRAVVCDIVVVVVVVVVVVAAVLARMMRKRNREEGSIAIPCKGFV